MSPESREGYPEPGNEEFRKISDDINKEGWDANSDEEGGAAIIIRKEGEKGEAEAARIRELLEKGKKCETLAEYIRLNRSVFANSKELRKVLPPDELEKWNGLKEGSYYYHVDDHGEFSTLIYKDKNKGLAVVSEFAPLILKSRIAEIERERVDKYYEGTADNQKSLLGEKLEKLGFQGYDTETGEEFRELKLIYKTIFYARQQDIERERKGKFDF